MSNQNISNTVKNNKHLLHEQSRNSLLSQQENTTKSLNGKIPNAKTKHNRKSNEKHTEKSDVDKAVETTENNKSDNVIKTTKNSHANKTVKSTENNEGDKVIKTTENNLAEVKNDKSNNLKSGTTEEPNDQEKQLPSGTLLLNISEIDSYSKSNEEEDQMVLVSESDSRKHSLELAKTEDLKESELYDIESDSSNSDEDQNKVQERTALFQSCIPYLPIEVASVCLAFNILIPGFGSILCGIFQFCCGKKQISNKKTDNSTRILINFLVGIMQFSTLTFFLVGWFWSIAWGMKILFLSIENHKRMKKQQQKKEKMKSELHIIGDKPNTKVYTKNKTNGNSLVKY
ncbi:Hypothetical predicted protein [Octopus vulgaris]|uniref:Protein stum-like n=1 Tax=Octopus vulgaris TaxID=6645 RepID=A0AA36AYV8_OCTVU|nr:Hypothetical predicted protein [Octopus vulgaris]